VDLPDMNGFELFRRLRQNLDLSVTPIIFMSGRSDEASWRRGLELGAVDYIEKPFSGSAFVRRILSHIKPVIGSLEAQQTVELSPKKRNSASFPRRIRLV
jgi:two-component system cell cycle response regulator